MVLGILGHHLDLKHHRPATCVCTKIAICYNTIDKKLENRLEIFEIFVNFEFYFEIFVNFEFYFEIFVNFEFFVNGR